MKRTVYNASILGTRKTEETDRECLVPHTIRPYVYRPVFGQMPAGQLPPARCPHLLSNRVKSPYRSNATSVKRSLQL